MYIYIYVYDMHTQYIYTCTYIYICICMYIYVCVRVCVFVCMCVCACIYIHNPRKKYFLKVENTFLVFVAESICKWRLRFFVLFPPTQLFFPELTQFVCKFGIRVGNSASDYVIEGVCLNRLILIAGLTDQ